MVTGKYYKTIPISVRRQCTEVTNNYTSDDSCTNIVFFNKNKEAIGVAYINYESFKLIKNKPIFSIYINSFEVCHDQQGKGYGPQMLKWIEKHLPIYRIELCHREISIDNKRSYNFWRSQGFRKPDKKYQTLVKRINK